MLTETQQKILKALVNCIIPPDEDPGGWEAGVGDYLYQQFERDLKAVVSLYQQGLLALDAEAQTNYQRSFADLAADAQDSLLQQVEQGQVQTNWPVNPVEFFMLVVHHCAEGFYSDPGNGGNREGVAWKMIGFEVRG
jgi:Gluconate 2-dehydrogenase subunit 3